MHSPDRQGPSPHHPRRPATRQALRVAGAITLVPFAAIAVLYAGILMILLPGACQFLITVIAAGIIGRIIDSQSATSLESQHSATNLIGADISGAALRSELRAVDPEAELDRRLAVLFEGLERTQRRSAFLRLLQDVRGAAGYVQPATLVPALFSGVTRQVVERYPFALVRYTMLSGSAYLIAVKLAHTPTAPDLGTALRVSTTSGGSTVCVVVKLGRTSHIWLSHRQSCLRAASGSRRRISVDAWSWTGVSRTSVTDRRRTPTPRPVPDTGRRRRTEAVRRDPISDQEGR